VKPNADLGIITSTAKEEINNLTNNDLLILCGGTRNIGKNYSTEGLHHITQFVTSRRNTNVTIPQVMKKHRITF
jgi:putative cell wall-binding protein